MFCVGLNQQIPTKLFERMLAHNSKLGSTSRRPLSNFGVGSVRPSITSRSKETFCRGSIIWFNSEKGLGSLNFTSAFFPPGSALSNWNDASVFGLVCADTDKAIVQAKAKAARK